MGPTVEAIAKEYKGKAVVGKIDFFEEGDLAAHYNVTNIPVFLFFKDGKVVDRLIGGQSKAGIVKKLENHISSK